VRAFDTGAIARPDILFSPKLFERRRSAAE